jgi:putative nucleotidyltransferase with HDIG domain
VLAPSESGAIKNMPNRDDAWELLCEYTKSDSLRKHALAVEAAMRAAAKRYGEVDADVDEWGLVGLLHDFDYEMFPTPDQHPFTGANILCGRGYSDRIIRAIMGHATYTGVPRDTDLARALFATDELCGFLVACALVRPNKSLDDLEVSSVKKKLKDKAFARSVNRDDIRLGVEELGVPLEDHIWFVIDALRPVQKDIGLNSSGMS